MSFVHSGVTILKCDCGVDNIATLHVELFSLDCKKRLKPGSLKLEQLETCQIAAVWMRSNSIDG